MGKKRKKKIFKTPEERAAWEKGYLENMDRLRAHVERITAELAAKRKPA
jgi:hypothetical protein